MYDTQSSGKKTQKGNSYGIVKFSDLNNVFELFIYSDIFEVNRNILKEGNSLMITLIKNYSDELKTQKRINVKKIISLKEVINKTIYDITFKFKDISELKKLNNLSEKGAETNIKIVVYNKDKILQFRLKNKRKIDNKLINSLNLEKNVFLD